MHNHVLKQKAACKNETSPRKMLITNDRFILPLIDYEFLHVLNKFNFTIR